MKTGKREMGNGKRTIGTTGRAGATGEADSLFTAGDKPQSVALVKIMTDAGQPIPPELARLAPQRIKFSFD
jgi:superfamily II DNA/RNA helicase